MHTAPVLSRLFFFTLYHKPPRHASILRLISRAAAFEILRKRNIKEHGRIEKRDDHLPTDLSWLPQRAEWDGLQAAGMVTATISRNDETTTDTRYFLSYVTDVEHFAYAVRKRWAIASS